MEANKSKQSQQPDVTYEEIGRVHRYFLNWRNALFAGHLAVVYALYLAYSRLMEQANQNQNSLTVLQLLLLGSGFILTLVFWGLERRTRDLYRACLKAGEAWETNNNVTGVYQTLNHTNSNWSHSSILDKYFLVVLLADIGLVILVCASTP